MRNNLYLAVIVIALFVCSCRTTPTEQLCSPDIPIEGLRVADIAFRLGRTIESDLIAASGGESNRYSHVGIIVNCDGEFSVIHIEPNPNDELDIIKQESLYDFFRSDRSVAGCVARIESLSPIERNIVQDKALRLFNSGITFDHKYALSDSSSMYCTELVENVFQSIGISLSQGRTHTLPFVHEPIILPSDIAQNEALNVVWSY